MPSHLSNQESARLYLELASTHQSVFTKTKDIEAADKMRGYSINLHELYSSQGSLTSLRPDFQPRVITLLTRVYAKEERKAKRENTGELIPGFSLPIQREGCSFRNGIVRYS